MKLTVVVVLYLSIYEYNCIVISRNLACIIIGIRLFSEKEIMHTSTRMVLKPYYDRCLLLLLDEEPTMRRNHTMVVMFLLEYTPAVVQPVLDTILKG